MIQIYQTIVDSNKGNCQQAAVASLLELPLEKVPNFKDYGDEFWTKCINFVLEKGYDFKRFIYNTKLRSLESYEYNQDKETGLYYFKDDQFKELQKEPGVKGYFIAGVYSPKFFDPLADKQTTHAVVIDKEFNIVNPINEAYKGMTKFPLHWLIGYNGILDIMIINEK